MVVTIKQLDRNLPDETVITVHWNASEVDGEYSYSSYGTQSFVRDADSPEFVPYADLTEEIVVGWLTLDEGLEAHLLAQIEEKKNPTSATGVPW